MEGLGVAFGFLKKEYGGLLFENKGLESLFFLYINSASYIPRD